MKNQNDELIQNMSFVASGSGSTSISSTAPINVTCSGSIWMKITVEGVEYYIPCMKAS